MNIEFAKLTVIFECATFLEHSRRNFTDQMITGRAISPNLCPLTFVLLLLYVLQPVLKLNELIDLGWIYRPVSKNSVPIQAMKLPKVILLWLIAGSRMKNSLALIAITGLLAGIDALQCYDCSDVTITARDDPEDVELGTQCSDADTAECEGEEVCISFIAISEVTLQIIDWETYDVEYKDVTYTNIIRSCGPAVPGDSIEKTCQYYQGLIPNVEYSGEEASTCNRETCEKNLCNTHENANLPAPVDEEDGEEGEEGEEDDAAGDGSGDTSYVNVSSAIVNTVSTFLAAITALYF